MPSIRNILTAIGFQGRKEAWLKLIYPYLWRLTVFPDDLVNVVNI